MFALFFVAYILLTSSGLLLMKLGIDGTIFSAEHGLLSCQINIKLIIGMLFYVASFLIYMFVLQRKDLSYIYPLSTGIVNIISFVFGIWILHEKVGLTSIIGVLFVIAGVVMLNLGK